jgi:hypothetical protein
VLSVLGTRSAAIFHEGRAVLHSWLPHTEDLDVDATHMLQIQNSAAVAGGLTAFFARHQFDARTLCAPSRSRTARRVVAHSTARSRPCRSTEDPLVAKPRGCHRYRTYWIDFLCGKINVRLAEARDSFQPRFHAAQALDPGS